MTRDDVNRPPGERAEAVAAAPTGRAEPVSGRADPGLRGWWHAPALGYAAVLLAFFWARSLATPYLVLAAGTLAAAALVGRRGGLAPRLRGPFRGVLVLALLALAAGAATDRRLAGVADRWDRIVAEREDRLGRELDREMTAVLRAARAATAQAAGLAATEAPLATRFAQLAELQAASGILALAVADRAGELVAWAGEHQGSLPLEVRLGEPGLRYREGPLVSYLYVTEAADERGARAVGAVMLETVLTPADGIGPGFAGEFGERRGAAPSFAAGDHEQAAWRLEDEEGVLLHARFEPLTQAEWRADVARTGRRAVVGLGALALLLLAGGWIRTHGGGGASAAARARAGAVVLGGSALALAVAPLGAVLGMEPLFSPALFLLPVPGEIVLGTLLAILLPLGALAAGFTPPHRRGTLHAVHLAVGAVVVAAGFAAGLALLLTSATPPLLEGGPFLWGALLPAAALSLTILAVLAVPNAAPHPVRPAALAAGLLTSAGLGLSLVARWHPGGGPEPWLPALWAVPFALLAFALAGYTGRGGRIARWLAMGWLAVSLVIPHLWVAQVQATLHAAERELGTLGTRVDPFVDYLLRQFAIEATARHERGEGDVELMFRSWISSGLAREADPARIILWAGPEPEPEFDLVFGDATAMRQYELSPGLFEPLVNRARAQGEPIIETAYETQGDHVLAVPLPDGRAISVIVPPRRTLERSAALLPFLGTAPRPDAQLTLIPDAIAHHVVGGDEIGWRRTDVGWRSEGKVSFPEGVYHAHLDLRLSPMPVQFARAVLLTALTLGLLALLWAGGRAVRGDPPAPPGGWGAWLGSFRGRVTLTLFAFFLLPTVIFGAVAYRALAGETTRAARLVAERAVSQAVDAFGEAPGDLRALAARTGEEVFYYYRGELADASSPEAVRMGVFQGWMPPSVYLLLFGGEELAAVESRELAERPYVVAYRRLPAANTLAVPVSLASGDAAARQRELADLILFAALMGGLLSLALSLVVGRALAGPIGRLRRAAGAVGAGRLDVRLPEDRTDEFGEVFTSFNRMVRRLRRARAQEVRTARVLAWGEMARQIAHAIKNPLTPIKLSVQHVRRAYRDQRPDFGEILDTNVEQALQEIDRLSELSRAFSRYGAPPEAAGELEAVDVAAVVREALMLYRAGDHGVGYREIVEEGLPRGRARVGELREVLLNLLENARAALTDGGTIEVSARRAHGGIDLVVRDDGEGIPPELLSRIFEPHFSTRSVGTGLGLAIVRRLVEGWGGTVAAESEPGDGAAVRVWVPAVSAGQERRLSGASGS